MEEHQNGAAKIGAEYQARHNQCELIPDHFGQGCDGNPLKAERDPEHKELQYGREIIGCHE